MVWATSPSPLWPPLHLLYCQSTAALWRRHFKRDEIFNRYTNVRQFYITCPVGIGLGCISKWLGWIPTVAPLRVSTFPTATINIFSTHQTFGTKKKKIPHTPRFFLEDVPKGCKVSDIRTDIHVHIVLEFCAKNLQ